ncbi:MULTISPECIES: hypothetical protein [Pseudoalteromonas]|uniref:Uncharacterized protein n=1 Tax=Pseudoalteromonas rubra TaxID=43658 RepID=A0A5S3USR1_9GAMM|nr:MULTISPECIES: hypothetical protein [Pseudoalteromonas]MCG7561298.1 hypothetical protein [Pseudoalteromonas sp. McH1-42]MEC4090722.1 hypothetical protein [Pseudoalteromonas rubra]QPB85633.1 hypothetical protein CWC22_021735 [Pseudoalteromonas rubra]
MKLSEKVRLYQMSLIASMLFAFVGFTYNAWRLEVSEQNNNIRTACFEMLRELAQLEQLIYIAHYDQDKTQGSPRKGWVSVGLINDFSYLTNGELQQSASTLKATWSDNWQNIYASTQAVDLVVKDIDTVRGDIKQLLNELD